MRIIQYPHPTLRHVSKDLRVVDAELRKIVAEMFELMYEARGVGLAANQVDLPYRLFIANPEGEPDSKETEFVFINPRFLERKGMAEGEEGCLSLPGLYAMVKRPDQVVINAYDLSGEEVKYELSGLFARIVQHESDHLDGVLFIDRLTPTGRMALSESLAEFELEFRSRQDRGEQPSDEEIAPRINELEQART